VDIDPHKREDNLNGAMALALYIGSPPRLRLWGPALQRIRTSSPWHVLNPALQHSRLVLRTGPPQFSGHALSWCIALVHGAGLLYTACQWLKLTAKM
jgi:hypothetical protein